MKTVHDIIVKPIITEDSMARTADKKYTFEVIVRSNEARDR